MSCCGAASGFAIGSAIQKVKSDRIEVHEDMSRIMLEVARLPEEEAEMRKERLDLTTVGR